MTLRGFWRRFGAVLVGPVEIVPVEIGPVLVGLALIGPVFVVILGVAASFRTAAWSRRESLVPVLEPRTLESAAPRRVDFRETFADASRISRRDEYWGWAGSNGANAWASPPAVAAVAGAASARFAESSASESDGGSRDTA